LLFVDYPDVRWGPQNTDWKDGLRLGFVPCT
jgi:hypothetical protein